MKNNMLYSAHRANTPSPSYSLQDWAHHSEQLQHGLRHDLRRLSKKISHYSSDIFYALLFASIMPAISFIGTLMGY